MNPATTSQDQAAGILQRLERLPLTWVQGRLVAMGGMGYTFDAVDYGVFAFVMPVIAPLFDIDDHRKGLLLSAGMIGYLFAALTAGILADTIGRKPVMMHALTFYCVATILSACASVTAWPFLFWTRVMAGMGTGAESAIIAPYIAEFIPSRWRGRIISSLAGFFSIGFVGAALLGLAAPYHWRLVLGICALPIVMLLWWRRGLLESPRWLIGRGRIDEAEAIVSGMEKETEKRTGRALPILKNIRPLPIDLVRFSIRRASPFENLAALWSPRFARRTFMLWALWFAINFANYGFITWIPSLLVEQGFAVSKSYGYTLAMYLAMVPGYYSAAFLVESLDRKWTIVLYALGSSLAALGMANAHSDAAIMTCGVLLNFFINGAYSGIYAYASELYPTSFRATGMGAASAFARLGSIAAPLVIGYAYKHIHFNGVFAMMTAVLFAGALVVALLGVPTSGKTLEEIAGE